MLAGKYEILSVLGEGGMGQVFEAHDRALNRRVAIKAAWPHQKPMRLRREAQALAALRHPSMVTVHTVDTDGDVDFIVMERVYGISLLQHIERRSKTGERFTVAEAVDILVAIADGLSVVHRAGIAHRDVKPANVMLAPGNRVVVMDFGLMLPEFEASLQPNIVGSPTYMSPEAISNTTFAGEAHLVDLYAFGVLAFEVLTGRPPFEGKSIDEVFKQHLTSPVPDIRTLRDDVPDDLARLLSEVLAKDPAARPQSVEALLWQLRAIQRPTATPRAGGAFTVLVVDDDVDTQKVLGFYAKKALPDAEIQYAGDGQAALDIVLTRPPDVMILDLQMPKMNGIEVCMYLRGTRTAERCTIVSVSAGAHARDLDLLQQLGIAYFVPKGSGLNDRLATVLRGLRALKPVARLGTGEK